MHCAVLAQSTSESVAKLRSEADACMGDFVYSLKSAGDDSKYFFDGEVLAKAETSKTDLESLVKKIDEQTDVLSKKEVAISSKLLPQAEKSELLAILAEQKKPLQDLKGRIAIFQQKLVQFTQTDAARWKDTFQSFESISGTERAQEKLKTEVETFLKSIPFLKDLEKNPPSAWKRKAPPAQSSPTPLVSPRSEGKDGVALGPSLQLQGGISIGKTSQSQSSGTPSASRTTSSSDANKPASSAATPKIDKNLIVKKESFFQFPRWFVVGIVLSVLIIIWGTKRSSDALMGLGWIGIIFLVPIWLIWLIYLWALRVIASW